jgi:MFS family permease
MNVSWKPTHRWDVVLCCFMIALFSWGLGFYGPGVYLVRLNETYGWSAAAISTGYTFYNLAIAAVVVQVGDAITRWGPRTVTFAGSIALGVGAGLLPVLTDLWQIYPVLAVMAFGFALMGTTAINTIIAIFFEAKRGLAISLAFNGASSAGVVVAPAMIWLTGSRGFAHGLWIVIAILCAVLWPLVFVLLRHRAHEKDARPDGVAIPHATIVAARAPSIARSALLRDRRFQTITLAFALGLAAQVGFLTHQVAYLSGVLDTVRAGWGVSLTTAMAVVGRIGTGVFIDRMDPRFVSAGNFLAQACALALFMSASSPAMVYFACALYGITLGNMITLPGLVVQREFSPEHFARVVSLLFAIDQVPLAFGPGLLGVVHDAAGSYKPALFLCLLFDALAFAVVLVRR